MEKDILEQYIAQNREDFDTAVPKTELWSKIDQNLTDLDTADNLEQYIAQNREDFDTAVPQTELWSKIDQNLTHLDTADNLEEYITQNREEFDLAIPSLNVWANIEEDLEDSTDDNLEQFISKERAAFDTAIPSLKVWAGINNNLSQRKHKRIRLWRSLSVAAAIAILLVTGGSVGSYLTQQIQPAMETVAQEDQDLLKELAPEFHEMEKVFNKEVDHRIQQLASFQHDNLVREDLAQLDAVMEELKQELLSAPKGTEQQILDNLIESYKTKLAILERVLERVQTNKPVKTSNNEISI